MTNILYIGTDGDLVATTIGFFKTMNRDEPKTYSFAPNKELAEKRLKSKESQKIIIEKNLNFDVNLKNKNSDIYTISYNSLYIPIIEALEPRF